MIVRIRLIRNFQLKSLILHAPFQSKISRRFWHSNHIPDYTLIHLDVDDLFTKIVLDEGDKFVEVGVGSDFNNVGWDLSNLDQLGFEDRWSDTHCDHGNSLASSVVRCVKHVVVGLSVCHYHKNFIDSFFKVFLEDLADGFVDRITSCGTTSSESFSSNSG